MTPTRASTPRSTPASTGPGRSGRSRPKRGEGQWALGYREPLNPNEQSKKDDNPLNVRARIENIYSHARVRLHRRRRPARPLPLVRPLHPAQARARRRQDRRPGARGARRRVLHAARPHRRRACSAAEQLRALGERLHRLRPRHRRHHRPAEHPVPLDPHRGRAGDLAAARGRRPGDAGGLRRLAPRRSSARPSPASPRTRSSTAPRRSTRSSAATSATPSTPTCRASSRPSLTGHPSQDVAPEVNDVSFVGTVAPRARPRLRPVGRRRPVHQPDARPEARRLDPARRGGRRLGGRHLGLPRLRLPPAALARPAEVPGRRTGAWRSSARCSRTKYLHRTLVDCPSPGRADRHRRPHRRARAEGRQALRRRRRPTVGRISGTMLDRLGDVVEQYGAGGRALTAYQKLVVLGVEPRTRSRPWSPRSTGSACRPRPSNWRRSHDGLHRHRVLQARDRRDQAARAPTWSPSSSSRFPDLDTPITVNVNGCPNACARTQVADIGLKGQLVLDDDGNQVEGFQVHLGGGARPRAAASAEAARPQGHQRRPRRLRRQRGQRFLERAHRGRAVRDLGRPRRRGRAARRGRPARRSRSVCDERRAIPFHCPYCGDENLRPSEEGSGRPGRRPGSATPACARSRSRCSA